ncbi:MAG: aryl-sulfate sulfotransferase [Solirubrobacterales bacterium]|nr:aryl-sulfate sulfotransferase [Solirubrobacterales bacterium]
MNGDVDGHDASPTGAGRWLMALHTTRSKVDLRPIGLAASGKTIDSSILEVDAHGKTLWSWSSAQHFATSESILTQVTKSTAGSIADLAHVNSFEEDGQGGIIASFRNTSAVYRIIKATGEIDWKLGGSTTPKSLTVLGDPGISAAFHLLGQHDARLQDDGTLTLFDNGSTVVQGGQRYSRQARALRIRIDPIARTATFVEAVTDPTIGSSPACGSAWRTADGHWLVAWGAKPSIRAYDKSGKAYFSLSYLDPQRFTYRAAPIESPSLTEAAVVSGMDYVR